ncbi:MAG TPA: DMT family transporter [Stackebrandtia sp.]|uniref:DMT family transporter n=1 Tax=Stackebrandtia sp. TaxID=2023065 RepID=UPI002D716AD9|nr:DMT family transporter [Stackebrandtia sp.]HZE41047.1 DMT family transporter [Stackebrandtia sp.]
MQKSHLRGAAQATVGMLLVGSLVAVNASIKDYPMYTAQAIRYTLASVVLCALLAARRPPRVRLTRRDVLLLAALATSGLAVFNVAIVYATHYSSAALVGTVVGSGPIVMAVLGPLVARGGRPSPRVIASAVVVTAGTAVATGLGGGGTLGALLAAVALAGEVSFSLLAMPLLPRLGALRVSAYTAVASVPILLALGLAVDGTTILRAPSWTELSAIAYLGLIVTVGGFLLWYDALPRLGPDRAGLFAGIMPVGAVATMMLLGQGTPTPAELGGAALVVGGIALGLTRSTATRTGAVLART